MHPVIFSFDSFHLFGRAIGPVLIHAYGMMLAVAFVAGMALMVREGVKAGLKPEDVLDETILIIIFSIIGARLLYILLNRNEYAGDALGALRIYQGGLSFHGGAIGGVLALYVFSRRRRAPMWRLADIAVPPLVLGSAIARWGCFLNGCCYGRPWDGPWGIVFPVLGDGLKRHPAQLYDSVLHLAMLPILFYLKKYKRKDSDLSAFYLIGFAILRFITEYFRAGATGRVVAGGITMAQFASVPIAAVGILLYFLPARLFSTPYSAAEAESKPKNSKKAPADAVGKQKKSGATKGKPGKKSSGR
ncbi:MAG TPA: prolipoprotein diacylglyceryl transferase [bacterium]|nr:prolipoprotein diacylglyceryl transferase [bacterium]